MRPRRPWSNLDPSTYQEEGPRAAPEFLRLPRPRFLVSDLGLASIPDPDQDAESLEFMGPRCLSGVSRHLVDCHAGYVPAQAELEARGYRIASQHRDGEGRLVLRWAHDYDRIDTLGLDTLRNQVDSWRRFAKRQGQFGNYKQAVLRFDDLAPKLGEREAYRIAKARTESNRKPQGG